MATWTTIPDSSLEPGKPIRSIDTLALRDNPVAIAEGAAGAPKILDAALSTTVTTAGEYWVQNRLAALTAGSIGTYAFAKSTTTSDVSFGSTRAGSALQTTSAAWGASALTTDWSFALAAGASLSGTWRCMGTYDYSTSSTNGNWAGATLWLRIA